MSLTQFDYLLNAFENASQSPMPARVGYGEKRRALFAYVNDLESRVALSETQQSSTGARSDPSVPHSAVEPVAQFQVRFKKSDAWINCPDKATFDESIACGLYVGRRLYAGPGLLTDERGAFEEWAGAEGFEIHRDDTEKYRNYHRATTRFAWSAWQARAAIARPKHDREFGEYATEHLLSWIDSELSRADAYDPPEVLPDEAVGDALRWLRVNRFGIKSTPATPALEMTPEPLTEEQSNMLADLAREHIPELQRRHLSYVALFNFFQAGRANLAAQRELIHSPS